ncbi:MAG TPA: bifunctional phosphoglucose/phosphomannose isomerase [Anaerolineae bacterium]|nr:bifunctional phosphoglucose/phosphomannose isomerase [Anaerolineae bacterium]HID84282.1 bifunctional phosphoglucose/phosphomannose isomerase [Anaerolineales bacterium]HIQ08190.1 bifunctional phosphoglucose/phosphomannose isomerase [Anaerolineaceae bacterium]
MDLNQGQRFSEIDTQNMLGEIDGLPDQLWQAWKLGQALPLPDAAGVQRVIIAGMGGSAIGADLLNAYIAPLCPLPVAVWRDYELPAWAEGPETLVIASSHSGNTEETLSAFEVARTRGCRLVAVTTGGQLAARADEAGATLWRFEHRGQPRAAVGYSFGLLLALFARLGWVPDPERELADAVETMKTQQANLRAEVPVTQNPAKRLAGQLMNRWVAVFGSGLFAPVARRWKGQVSEIAKAWAQFEFLPEADHNTLAGILNPEPLFAQAMMLFLTGSTEHTRNQLRVELTRKAFMVEGLNTDVITAPGETRLAQQWALLHCGDYVAYYLSMLYETDPTPVTAIEGFKAELKAASA